MSRHKEGGLRRLHDVIDKRVTGDPALALRARCHQHGGDRGPSVPRRHARPHCEKVCGQPFELLDTS
jgi:hypothetical protein